MATIKGGGRGGVSMDVELRGFFFRGNPVGRLHVNTYDVLKDEGDFAVEAAKNEMRSRQRQYGKGTYPGVELAEGIVRVPMRKRRSLMRVVVSATYGPQPWVRKYNRFIEDASLNRPSGGFKGYHIYRSGARKTQQHINGRIGQIANHLAKGLT